MHINPVQDNLQYTNALEEFYAKQKSAREALGQIGQEMLLDEFKKFFAEHPDHLKIAFTAYTPYFNDGDPCYYSVHDYYYFTEELYYDKYADIYMLDQLDQIDDFYDWDENWKLSAQYVLKSPTGAFLRDENKNLLWEETEAGQAAKKLFEDRIHLYSVTANEDVCQMVYGDHVQVMVTPTEIIISDYDHD